MVEIKSLILAIICFFTQEQIPVISTDVTLFLDVTEKIIIIEQHNLSTIKEEEQNAIKGLKAIKNKTDLVASMQNVTLISKEIFVKNNELNAKIKLSYTSIKDIADLGFSLNTDGTYSYFKSNTIELLTDNGIEKEDEFIFKADKNIKFKVTPKLYKDVKLISLAPAWSVK